MVIIKNLTTNRDITNFIEELNVTSPKINTVTSLEVNFNLFENLIKDDDVININIDDLFIFEGKAKIAKLTKNYKLQDIYSISVFDEMEKYYTKKVSEDFTKFDVYLCNNTDVKNSLLHIIAEQLGVVGVFDEVKYEDGSYIKVPFVVFEKDTRYIDLLQTYIKATDGYLYFSNGKLFFKLNNFNVLESFIIDDNTIINEVQETQKTTEYNGIKVLFDNFKILETQKVFKLSEKIVVEPNTLNPETMKINYSTSSAMNVNLTKATGYYFTSEDVKSKVVVDLLNDINCTLVIDKIGGLGAEIKIINKLSYKLYVDNIEIIGNPLVKYQDNESKIIKKGIEEKEENIYNIEKNSYIQDEKHSKYIAKKEYQKNIESKYNYKFNTILTNRIELGRVYVLKIGQINKWVQINSIDIKINLNEKYMTFTGEEITELVEVVQKNKFVANPTGEFLQLKNLEKEIDEEKAKNQELEQKINAKMITSITEPKEDINNNDIWYNSQDNTFKKYFEGVWVAIQEKELLPSMKHWASLENAKIKMGEIDKKAGLFLINEGEKFGTINGTLAEVTLDKQGGIVLKNANNLLEWNVKNPADPSQITSRLLMGVTDVDNVDKNVYFKIGDSAVGFGLEFRKNGSGIATIDGVPVEDRIKMTEDVVNYTLMEQNTINADLTNKIISTNNTINTINTNFTNKIDGITKELVDANGKYTTLQQNYNNISKDVTNFKTQTTSNLDTITTALQKGNFIVTGNTVFDGSATVISRGASERIQINGGSIDFFRTVGGVEKKLSTIKNIRYGVINTDSKGKGVVNFDGFKQPMLVFTTIKAINLGKNIASMFCYAEHVSGTTYRFYVGGTNEVVKEATPIKVLGTSWRMSNVMETTLLGITGNTDEYTVPTTVKTMNSHTHGQDTLKFTRVPKIRLNVIRVSGATTETIYTGDYTFTPVNYRGWKIFSKSFNQVLNLFKKYVARTNVEYKIRIDILEPHVYISGLYYKENWVYSSGAGDSSQAGYHLVSREYGHYDDTKPMFTLTQAHFKNLSITASAQTSTIVDSSGTGDVSYIAMEVE